MMKTRVIKTIFLIAAAAIITMPALFTDLREHVASDIDNRNLAEISTDGENFTESVNRYLEDRVGFRKQAISLYQTACNLIFHKLTMPNYRYGKKDDIYSEVDLATYQHRDTPEDYPSQYAGFIKSLQDLSQKNGSGFMFLLIPNKETIYDENFPDGYNIKDQKNRTELILDEMARQNVNHVSLIDEFKKNKDNGLLYNKQYDVLHWNDRGCLLGMQELIKVLHEMDSRIDLLKDEEVKRSEILQKTFINSDMVINETVPDYEIETPAVEDTEEFFGDIDLVDDKVYYYHYRNDNNPDGPKILVFGDSYFGFFSLVHESLENRASDLTLIHTNNITAADRYILKIKPDIVIVEAVERVLTADNGQWSSQVVENRF